MFQIRFKKTFKNIIKFKRNLLFARKRYFKNIFLKNFQQNAKLEIISRILLKNYKNPHSLLRLRKACLLTGKCRSIIPKIMFKRHMFQRTLELNNVPNIIKK